MHELIIYLLAGCCYSVLLKDSHPCVEGAMHHDCPICFEVHTIQCFFICMLHFINIPMVGLSLQAHNPK